MSRHVMVDLETLGTSPDSVIVSIGAVVFTDKGVESKGYWPLHLEQPDRNVDLSTVKWWMSQSDAARAVFANKDVVSMNYALDELRSAFDADTCIWSYGANFDEVILAHAYRQKRERTPWSYKNVRCFRTIRAQYPDVEIAETGTKHNALDDAKWQTELLLEIAKQKGVML